MAQRKAGTGPLPRIHPVRRRHGGQRFAVRRCRTVDDAVRHAGGAGPEAGRLHRQDQQPQAAGRGAGSVRHRAGRPGAARHGAAGHRQAGPAGGGRRVGPAGRGPQGRLRRFHQGRRPDAGPGASHPGVRRARRGGRRGASAPDRNPGRQQRHRRGGAQRTGTDRQAAVGLRLWPRPGDVRYRRGARPGLLHRRGVRGATDLPGTERSRRGGRVRLGGGRRAL